MLNRFRQELNNKGFCFISADSKFLGRVKQEAAKDIFSEISNLPKDKYCSEGTKNRRFGKFIYKPWNKSVELIPDSEYYQPENLNKVDGGVRRQFEPLSENFIKNKFFKNLIRRDFSICPFSEIELKQPFACNVHFIDYIPKLTAEAVGSPNYPHQDGETFTFIHLLTRDGVEGGETLITDLHERPLFETTLLNPFDTAVVWDEKVKHHVKPVRLAFGKFTGHRAVLLVDFTPMLPAVELLSVNSALPRKSLLNMFQVSLKKGKEAKKIIDWMERLLLTNFAL